MKSMQILVAGPVRRRLAMRSVKRIYIRSRTDLSAIVMPYCDCHVSLALVCIKRWAVADKRMRH